MPHDADSEHEPEQTTSTASCDDGQLVSQEITVSKKRKVTRSQWTQQQRDAVFRQLSHCVNLLKVPKKADVEEAITKEDVLRDIPWHRIKDLVYYKITSRKLHFM
ncbi:hypothetical protein LSAT2_001285 [Lamellibrachia satsuma]|nr:hypothetical protein LSAT2_001285 [Lamellibrachia satsuma]